MSNEKIMVRLMVRCVLWSEKYGIWNLDKIMEYRKVFSAIVSNVVSNIHIQIIYWYLELQH